MDKGGFSTLSLSKNYLPTVELQNKKSKLKVTYSLNEMSKKKFLRTKVLDCDKEHISKEKFEK